MILFHFVFLLSNQIRTYIHYVVFAITTDNEDKYWHSKLNMMLFHVLCLLIWANLWYINLIFIFILSIFETDKGSVAEETIIKVISAITFERHRLNGAHNLSAFSHTNLQFHLLTEPASFSLGNKTEEGFMSGTTCQLIAEH